MKRLIISLITVISFCSIFVFADFSASVTLDTAKETKYTTAIDTVLDKFTNKYNDTQLHYKFPIIQGRITKALQDNDLPKDIIFILEYLQRYVTGWMDDNKEDTTTQTNTDKENTSSNNNSGNTNSNSIKSISPSTYDEGEKTISNATFSGPVVKFEITANYEDILVEKFSIIANNSSLSDLIATVYIYDENGDLIGSDNPNGDSADFNEEFIIKEGKNTFYLGLLPRGRDDININESFTFSMHITEATSSTNGSDIDPIVINNSEDEIILARAALGSAGIQLLNTYNNRFVDNQIYNQARADLAIISIDFSDTTGNDNILLESMEFTLEDGTIAGDVHTTVKLKRIDNGSTDISIDTKNGNQITFDLNNLGSKQKIKAGGSAVFMVTGVPLLDPTKSEYIKIELSSNQTSNGIFTYSTEDDASIIGTKGEGYIGKTTVND